MAEYRNVQIPVSKDPRNLDTTKAVLRFDTPKETPNRYGGTTYIYGCEWEGGDATIMASEALHREIQGTGAGKGSEVELARLGEGKETRWFAFVSEDPFEPKENGQPGFKDTRESAPAGRGFEAKLAQYNAALDEAILIAERVNDTRLKPSEVPFARLDLNAVAFTLMKMADDTNTDLTKRGDAPG